MTLFTDRAVEPDVDPENVSTNPTTAPPLMAIAEARLSRRGVLAGGLLAAAGFLTAGLIDPPAAAAGPGRGAGGGPAGSGGLGFQAIGPSKLDEVVVAPGYTARPFIPWGTPILGSFPAFVPGTPGEPGGVAGGNTADQQAEQVGMHHDGMTYFPLHNGPRGSEMGLLVLNQEYTDEFYLHTARYPGTAEAAAAYKPSTAEGVRKSQNAHGVSVVEVQRRRNGQWELVRSGRNRRITANTPMSFSGPAAGHRLVRTAADPEGRTPVGTFNNCANGETPWGTYLTCEENFNGYFSVPAAGAIPALDAESAGLATRYGVGGDRNGWAVHDPRFRVTPQDANEPNRHGWVVEIDPFDAGSVPVKRTALGRLKHEDATVHVGRGGKVVVYMGDDQVNEFVYKFVSARNWKSMRAQGKSPLDEGTLYVARFHEDGSGEWLPLVHGQGPLTADKGFADQGDVLVKTRLAATALGATPMDRPEWTAVDPRTGTVFVTLTNNSSRTQPNGPNPRVLPAVPPATAPRGNPWGHIVRWDEENGDHTGTRFAWDLFLLAGPGDGVDGSTVEAEDAFGSPDGLWIDPDGRAWIQTDGTQPDRANNQMLVADATAPWDAEPEVRRFLTGVVGCEVTGIAYTPDRRTMFVNLQHPGENGGSSWPHDDEFETPRSATVVITKDDGGVIGT